MVATTSHIFSGKVDIASNLQVGSSHLFVDTENNRVGLNESNPSANLHVSGNAYISSDLTIGTGVHVTGNTVTGRMKVGDSLTVDSLTPGSVPFINGGNALEDSFITQGTDTVTITSNLEVNGNVNISGETYTIDTQSLEVKDRIIGIAYDNTLNGADTGILMEYPNRNVGLIHHGAFGNPYAQEFTIGYTQNTASDSTIINDTANVITVNVLGHFHTQNNITVGSSGSYYGDGTTLTGVALATNLTSNAARISALEDANTVQASLISTLNTNLSADASRITTLEDANTVQAGLITTLTNDLSDNTSRITTLEDANTVQAGLITTLTSDLSDNASRITTLEDANTVQAGLITTLTNDLSDNTSRITTLEDANTVQAGLITTLTSDLSDNASRITTLEDANTVQAGLITTLDTRLNDNASRVSTLEDANTVQAGLITTLTSDLSDNTSRITTLEDANTVQAGLITTLTNDLSDNTARVSALEATDSVLSSVITGIQNDLSDNSSRVTNLETSNAYLWANLADNSARISNLTLDDVVNVNNTTSNIINVTGLTTTANVEVGSNLSISGLTIDKIPIVGTGNFLENSSIGRSNGTIVISSDLEVLGNIVTNGNSYTIESNNLVINDRILGIANNNTSHELDVGIIMQHPGKNIGLIHHGESQGDSDPHNHTFTIGYTQNTVSDNHIFDDSNLITVEILGNLITQNNLTVTTGSYYGDGTTLTGVALSSDLADNASRISTVELDLASNASRIGVIETDLTSRVSTLEDANTVQAGLITTLTNDLSDNASRVSTLEDANTVQAGLITTLDTRLNDNASRVSTLEDANTVQAGLITTLTNDLSDNASRVSTLEDANTVQAGLITTLTNDLSDNASRVSTLEDANTVQAGLITTLTNDLSDNASRVSTLEDANTVQAGLITTLTNDISDNASRVSTLEDANTVQAGLITTLTNDLSDNASRVSTLEDANTVQAGLITTLTNDLSDNASRVSTLEDANTVQAGLITTLTNDLSDNASRVSTLEAANTVQAGLISTLQSDVSANDGRLDALEPRVTNLEYSNVDIWSNLASNVTRIGNLETNLSDNSARIDALTLDDVVNVNNATSNTVRFTNATTSLTASGNVTVSGNVTSTTTLISNAATLGTTKEFVVTASGGVFYIDGVQQDSLELHEHQTYLFDLTNPGTSHPFRLATVADGGGAQNGSGSIPASDYTAGTDYTSVANHLKFTVPAGAPSTLYYYCTIHSGMGGSMSVSPTAELIVSGRVVASGNVEASSFKGDGSQLTNIASNLQAITDNGNVTSNTVQFTNTGTSLVASGTVEAVSFVGSGAQLTDIASNLEQIVNNGNVTSNTILLTDATTGLVATGNVEALKFIGDGSELTNIASNLEQIANNGNVTSNTILLTDATTGLVATGNVHASKFIGDGSLLTNLPGGSGGIWNTNGQGEIYYLSNVGISNTDPGHDLSVGSNLYVDDDGSNVLVVTGNVKADYFSGDGSLLTNLPSGSGGVWSTNGDGEIYFTDSNVGISNADPGHNLSVGSNLYVDDDGSNVLVVTGNVKADYFSGDGSLLTNLPSGSGGVWSTNGDGEIYFINSNVGISNADPGHNLSVGSNLYVDDDGSNVLVVNGNVSVGSTLTLDGFAISASQGLNDILNESNTSSNTMQLTNMNVGLVATGNVEANYFIGDGSQLTNIASTLQAITDSGNTTSNTIQITSADVSLAATGNVEANYFIGDGSQLTNIASTLQAITDSGNTTSNTIQITSADVSLTTSGNVEIGSELSVSSNVEVGTANLFVDTVNSMIGIGTNTPESILHVSDTLTNYKIKPIPLNGAPEGGAYYGYILLAKAAMGGINSESYVVGKILARRGTATSGHKLNYYDVVSSRGYNHYEILSVDRVGNRTGNDGFTSTVKVTYNGTVYHALRTGSTGGQPSTDLTFWGSSKDAGLIMVDSSMVSNETAYGSITRSAVNGNVGIGTANPTSLLDVNGTFSVSGPTTGATHSDGGILYLLDTPIIDEWSWTGPTANTLRITYASTELPANCKAVLAEVFMPKSNNVDHVGHSLGKNYSSATVWTGGNQQPSTRFTLNRQTTFLDMRGDSDNFEYFYGKWFSSVIIPLDTGNTVYHIVAGESSGTSSWVYVVTRGYYI